MRRIFCVLGPLFCALVWKEAIVSVNVAQTKVSHACVARSGKTHCALGSLFFAVVRKYAIFAVSKRCANKIFAYMCKGNNFVQHPRGKCDFGGTLTDDEVIDSSTVDIIVKKTRFHSLVGEANERSVVGVKEVTKKKKWRSIVVPLGMNDGREQIFLEYGYRVDKVKHNL